MTCFMSIMCFDDEIMMYLMILWCVWCRHVINLMCLTGTRHSLHQNLIICVLWALIWRLFIIECNLWVNILLFKAHEELVHPGETHWYGVIWYLWCDLWWDLWCLWCVCDDVYVFCVLDDSGCYGLSQNTCQVCFVMLFIFLWCVLW